MADYTGRVSWFLDSKGYGFVSRDNGADVFVHYSMIQTDGPKSLKEGESVEFDIADGPNGKPQAVRVNRLDSASMERSQ